MGDIPVQTVNQFELGTATVWFFFLNKWISNIDSVLNWEEIRFNCIHFWIIVGELLGILHN